MFLVMPRMSFTAARSKERHAIGTAIFGHISIDTVDSIGTVDVITIRGVLQRRRYRCSSFSPLGFSVCRQIFVPHDSGTHTS